MFRNLAANLIVHERIETTEAKAKELRRVADRLVSLAVRLGPDLAVDIGKLGDDERHRVSARRMHAQRLAAARLPAWMTVTRGGAADQVEDVNPVHRLFHEIAPRYLERNSQGKGGGYTRIMKRGRRRGDGASMVLIELLGEDGKKTSNRPKRSEESSGLVSPDPGPTGAAPAATASGEPTSLPTGSNELESAVAPQKA